MVREDEQQNPHHFVKTAGEARPTSRARASQQVLCQGPYMLLHCTSPTSYGQDTINMTSKQSVTSTRARLQAVSSAADAKASASAIAPNIAKVYPDHLALAFSHPLFSLCQGIREFLPLVLALLSTSLALARKIPDRLLAGVRPSCGTGCGA